MQIRLLHITTGKRLHSHDIRPPVTEVDFQNEVSGYGSADHEGDGNDNWIVELEHGAREDSESWKRLRTLRTHFKLRHPLQGCYLFSHKVKLPQWAYEQQEVTCNKNAARPNSLWYIETATHPACKCSCRVYYLDPDMATQCPRTQRRSTTETLVSWANSSNCRRLCGSRMLA